jgi:hypothetical protein
VRFTRSALIVLLIALTGCQNGPAQPTAGVQGDYVLSGQSMEFTFSHRGSNIPMEVAVTASPAGSVGFNVYNDRQWRERRAGVRISPLGSGAASALEPGVLTWQGSSPDGGLYYVEVFPLAQPATFSIAVSGPGAGSSIPSRETPLPQPAEPQQAAVAASPAPVVQAPLAPPATREPVATASPVVKPSPQPAPFASIGQGNYNVLSDQAMEFDFRYQGGNQPVNVMVGARPPGSVGFSVYTDQQWTLYGAGEWSVVPIGKGTANPVEPGTLFWQGSSPSAGLYHVQVFRLAEPASFWIALTGPGAASELIPLSPAVVEP